MTTQNNFLQSSLTTNNLATNTAVLEISSLLENEVVVEVGNVVDVTGVITDFDFTLAAQTSSVTVNVDNFPAGGDGTITDVNFTTSQTELLGVNSAQIAGIVPAFGNGLVSGQTLQVVQVSDGPITETRPELICGNDLYVEEKTHGQIAAAVRSDAIGSLVDTDQELAPLQVNNLGFLKTSQNTEAILASLAIRHGGALNQSDIIAVNMYGSNSDVDTGSRSQICEGFNVGGSLLTLPSVALTNWQVVSNDGEDDFDLPGTGCLTLQIYYSDVNGVVNSTEVEMDGVTPVDVTGITAGHAFRFVRAIVKTAGFQTTNVGTITVYETGTPANVLILIGPREGVSACAAAYIPPNRVLYAKSLNAHIHSDGADDVRIRVTGKTSNSVIWKRLFPFTSNATANGANDYVAWDLKAVQVNAESLSGVPGDTAGMDFRATAIKLTGGGGVSVTFQMGSYHVPS